MIEEYYHADPSYDGFHLHSMLELKSCFDTYSLLASIQGDVFSPASFQMLLLRSFKNRLDLEPSKTSSMHWILRRTHLEYLLRAIEL